MRRTRTNHADGFKVEVVLATLKGDKMLSELAQKRCAWHRMQITGSVCNRHVT